MGRAEPRGDGVEARRTERSCAWPLLLAAILLALGVAARPATAAAAAAAATDPTPGSLPGQAFAYGDTTTAWPVAPIHQQHPIRGSFLDPRPGEVTKGGEPGYHIGIDISVRDDRPEAGHPRRRTHRVYAIEGGIASVPAGQATASCSDRKVTIGHFQYWHTDTLPAITDGEQIAPGQLIGWTCRRMWHVHLSEVMLVNGQWTYVDPLHSVAGPPGPMKLQPYVDTAPPAIHAIAFDTPAMPAWSVVEQAVLSQGGGTPAPADQLHGYVDVRGWIDDPQSFLGWYAVHPELYAPLHPYKLSIGVTDANTGQVVLARDVFQADDILNSAAASPPIPIGTHYAPGTRQNLPARPCRQLQPADCKGAYWFRLFATPATGAYWDTRQLPDGPYRIDVTAWDTAGNSAASSVPVTIANAGAPAPPDFAVAASPAARTVARGGSADFAVAIASTAGFAGPVALAVAGLPPGVSASASPNPATGSSVLTVTVAATAAPGRYALTVVGTFDGITHTGAPVTLVIPGRRELAARTARCRASACGGAWRRVSAPRILRAFRAVAGAEPNVAVSSRRLGRVLDETFESAARTRRYERLFGRFTIQIAPSRAPAAGHVRWRRLASDDWVAVKRYGRNVVLRWTAPASGPALDRRWRRLDRMLGSLAAR